MKKLKFIFLAIVLTLIAAGTTVLSVFTIRTYSENHKENETAIIQFDTDGGEELYPFTNYEKNDLQYIYHPYKTDCVFLGWTYKDDYIENYDPNTFLKAGTYIFKAKWQAVDSVEESKISNAIKSENTDISNIYLNFTRNGYNAEITFEGENYKKWFNSGIAALDLIENVKINNSEYDKKICQYDFSFCNDYEYNFSAKYVNDYSESVNKLTDFYNNNRSAVSLMTKDEYINAKTLLSTEG